MTFPRRRNRFFRRTALALKLVAGAVLSSPLAAVATPPESPAVMKDDAQLHDVFFNGSDRGWAVGDRGALWLTRDGGRHWSLQRSHTTASLRSVHFTDADNGWIVGSWVEPYRHTSRGVVLRTRDGGESWTPTPAEMLPGLHKIRMLDAQNGWAVGYPSPLFPAGVFKTSDGGRSWSTVPVGSANGLATGDFSSMDRGVIAGADGSLRLVIGPEVAETRTPDLEGRPLADLRMEGPSHGWLVGADGLVFATSNGGASWQRPSGELPASADNVDMQSIATLGQHVWVAGAPGAFVFHSPDRGATWRALPTGQTAPLHGLHFTSEREGWAVGALGRILHTRNAGESWEVQKEGGRRLALWSLSASAGNVPLELVAAEAGGVGHLIHATFLFPPPHRDAFAATVGERLHAAVVAAGGSGGSAAQRFAVRNRSLATSRTTAWKMLDEVADGQARNELIDYLVRQIRQWKPSVIVVDDPSDGPFEALAFESLLQAVAMAGDPTALAHQITTDGLDAHRVARVFSANVEGRVRLSTATLLPQLASSVADYASHGRGLLETGFRPAPEVLAFRGVNGATTRRGLLDGLSRLEPARGARRRPAEPLAANLAQLQSMIQKGRNARSLLSRTEAGGGELLLGQLDDLTQGVNGRAAGELTFRLAASLHRQGRSELAAEAFTRLAQRRPDSPLAQDALVWLVQYYSSGETRHLRRSDSKMTVGYDRFQARAMPARDADARPTIVDPAVRPTSAVDASSPTDSHKAAERNTLRQAGDTLREQRGQQARRFAQIIRQTRPVLYEDPRMRFALSVAQRQTAAGRSAEGFYRRTADEDSPPGWRESAQAELWLSHLQGRPPKPVHPCFFSAEKPFLDAVLDDRVWQAAQPMPLQSTRGADESVAARVWLAYDADYLYLAAACGTAPDRNEDEPTRRVSAGDRIRRRDADLSSRDRIEIFLDVDRDYATAFRLQIDDRGWARDSVFGNEAWNPQWHIAHRRDASTWTIEAAVPLRELTHEPITDAFWALGVRRIYPDVDLQSWTLPAAIDPQTQTFGLLNFQKPR